MYFGKSTDYHTNKSFQNYVLLQKAGLFIIQCLFDGIMLAFPQKCYQLSCFLWLKLRGKNDNCCEEAIVFALPP